MVLIGFVTACRLAGCPTSRSPSLVNATMEGVVRIPSAFSISRAALPSMTATRVRRSQVDFDDFTHHETPLSLLLLLFPFVIWSHSATTGRLRRARDTF